MYKVLIVEDDPMVAMINEQYLAHNPQFRLSGTRGDGDSALKFLEENEVDLLILDIFMPRMNGIELLRRIREQNIPVAVIMVTAANDVVTLEDTLRLGIVDYLVKPFAYDRFQAALNKFLSMKGALKGVQVLRQENIDNVMSGFRTSVDAPPKGIREQTLRIILDCLYESGEQLSGEDIAERVGLSAVTVRRYMNHLIQAGSVTGEMNYGTGGRPRMLYRAAEAGR